MSRTDDFQGDNAHLVECINALLDLDDDKALVPHGLGKGSHAYRMLTAAYHRLTSATSKVERLERALADGKQSLEVAIYGLPEMLERNALSDDENMVGQLQCAVERMSAALKGDEQ